jgi:formylglycine-generating enzyme required for sulfatase activity
MKNVRLLPAVSVFMALLVGCDTLHTPGSSALSADGRPFHECRDCPEMVALPGGQFVIGSPIDEGGRDRPRALQEGPPRTITIERFALGTRPVTRGEWSAFVVATGRPPRRGCAWSALDGNARRDGSNEQATWTNLGFTQDDDHPVVCVAWTDAQDYVAWLSARSGHRYRLPSEAEWEYAARAGTSTAFPWGVDARRDRANYGAERCCSSLAEGADRWAYTSPVGAFPPNAFGLYDMHGNAMQWVQDCVAESYIDLPTDGSAYERDVPLNLTDPAFQRLVGQSSCAYRILRGGNWGDPPALIRSAARNFGPPPGAALDRYASAGGGFRVARSLDR